MNCGCDPTRGVICEAHCQFQGCWYGVHTPECIAGERVDPIVSDWAAERLVTCRYRGMPHPLDDECVDVTYVRGGDR